MECHELLLQLKAAQRDRQGLLAVQLERQVRDAMAKHGLLRWDMSDEFYDAGLEYWDAFERGDLAECQRFSERQEAIMREHGIFRAGSFVQ